MAATLARALERLDPANPARLNPPFDRGDHVHPNELGNMAIADIVPLSRL